MRDLAPWTKSLTQTQRNYHERYYERYPARDSILLLIGNVNEHGSVKIIGRYICTSRSAEDEEHVSNSKDTPATLYGEKKLI